MSIGEIKEFDVRNTTETNFDPGFCCNTGLRRRCIGGGGQAGKLCESSADCLCTETSTICCDVECCDADPECTSPTGDGLCPARIATPGARAMKTTWIRFETPERESEFDPEFISVRLSTCQSNAPAEDSLLQVYSIPSSSTSSRQVVFAKHRLPSFSGGPASQKPRHALLGQFVSLVHG